MMYAAIVWFDDGITVIKNEDEAALLRSTVEAVMTGQEGWCHGIVDKGFDEKLSEILAMEEIEDYENIYEDLKDFLIEIPVIHPSELFDHNR